MVNSGKPKVTLSGWLEFVRMNMFFTLRDGYGSTQVVTPEALSKTINIVGIPFESILKVTETIVKRPPGQKNKYRPTSRIEVMLDSLQVLNPARSLLPIPVQEQPRQRVPPDRTSLHRPSYGLIFACSPKSS